MADITYCVNESCPFKDCERHSSKISEAAVRDRGYVSISDFGGICRDYIGYLVDKEYDKKDTKNKNKIRGRVRQLE